MLAREERLVRAPGEGLQLHFGKQQSAWGDRGEDTAQAGARQDGSGELWEPCGGAQRPFGFSLRNRKGLWPPYRRGVRRLDPREARQPGTPELAGQDPALPESRPHGDVGTVPPRVVR